MSAPETRELNTRAPFVHRLRERGVLRVAASYAIIAWLLLQIASVVLDPLGVPKWVMTALILAAVAGFPIAIALAWFLEIGEQGVEVDAAADGRVRPTVRGLRHYADAIVIGVLVIAVVVLLVRQSDLGKPKPPENPAIAVLPFENLSGDPEQEYFSDGLAEEMLDRLGRVPGLKVIARSSSFGFKGKDVDAKDVAAKLGVTTVLEGSVRRAGARLKLNARLVDGTSGQQVWSGSFDREVNDVFAVQAELAVAIVNAIIPAARGEVVDTVLPPTTDLQAYDLYLLARTQLAMRTNSSILKSVELMERAVQLDPNFSRAHAHLAASLLFARLFDVDPSQKDAFLRRAEASIYRALALDPDSSEAFDAQGNLLRDTSRPGAEEAYKRAIELNPNNAAAWHDYAVFLSNDEDRQEEGDRATERSLELDPRQPVTWANYLSHIVREGDRKRFEEERARGIRTVGDMPGVLDRFPNPIWATDREGYRQEMSRRIDEAQRQAEALDGLTMPGASLPGFPVEVMKAGLAKSRHPTDAALPVALNFHRAWVAIDLELAGHAVTQKVGVWHGVDFQVILLFLETEVAGLQGDWARLDRTLQELRSRNADQARIESVAAFWLSMRGRYDEAATALAKAEPLPDMSLPPMLGGDTRFGQMGPAKVRILRGTGRSDEAQRFANEVLERMRKEWREVRGQCDWEGWMLSPTWYAGLAANEGLKDEAVAALTLAMRCGDMPFGFWPQLPWFRSLEGYEPYDALLKERQARVERIRGELLEMEAAAQGKSPVVKASN